jgi:hypothetical protein
VSRVNSNYAAVSRNCNSQKAHSICQPTAMAQPMESGRVCRRCGSTNSADAKRRSSCGTDLDIVPESGGSIDDDPALRYVDPNNRTELDRFEREDEAELACGLLRSSRIACELSPMPVSGLPADIIFWVHKRDA